VVVLGAFAVGALFTFSASASVTGALMSVTFGAGFHTLTRAFTLVVRLSKQRG